MGFLRYNKSSPSTAGGTGRVVIGAGESPFKSLLMNSEGQYIPSGNPLPYMGANNLPKNGVLGARFNSALAMPSFIVKNSTNGSNNGTRMVLSWEGSATEASGQAMILGGSYSVAAGGDPFALVGGNPFFSLNVANNAGHTTGGRVEFYLEPGSPLISFTFGFIAGATFTNLTNVIICRASDEASLLAAIASGDKAGYFLTEYLDVYKAINCNPVRPMGWSNPNDSNNFTQNRYRTPWANSIGLLSWKYHPNCVAGDNGGGAGVITGTNAYSAASAIDTPGTLTSGEVIQGYFPNANTGSGPFTFSRGGSTPLRIINIYGLDIVAGEIAAGSRGTLFLDLIMDGWVYVADGLAAKMPIEMQIAFCNEINADFWCNFSAHVTADSVTEIVTIVRDQLKPTLKARFELGNEIWNTLYPYQATSYYRNRGGRLGFPSGDNRETSGAYGLRIAQLFPSIATAWAPRDPAQLCRMMCCQSAVYDSAVEMYRMWGADLSTSLGYAGYNAKIGVNYNAKPNRPVDHCEDISYATYWSGGQTMQFGQNYVDNFGIGLNINNLMAAADDYDSANPTRMASAIQWMDDDMRDGVQSNGNRAGLETLRGWRVERHPVWNTKANTINADRPAGARPVKIVNYEGAHGISEPSTADCTTIGINTDYSRKIKNLIYAYKKSDQFYATCLLQLNDCMAFSNYGAPAWFVMSGQLWGPRDGDDLFTPLVFRSWDALVSFNH